MVREDETKYLMHTYNRFNIVMESGQGCYLKDENGKEYLDLTSGIGVNCLGHNHPVLVEAIQKQGFLGVISGGLTAGAAGISAAVLCGYVAALFSKSQDKS